MSSDVDHLIPDELWSKFKTDAYADDPIVRVFQVEGVGVDTEFICHESLWHRLRLIGSAYGLHLLPLLDGSTDPVFLNAQQCENLITELYFVGTVTNDGLLETVLHGVERHAREARGASKNALGIEFP